MREHFKDGAPWEEADMDMRSLEDGDIPQGFDCGAQEQNRFLYECAWRDTCRSISVTHVLFIKGVLAGYVTLLNDRIRLGPREKPKGVAYQLVPAVKIGQLGIDRRFQRFGLGRFLIGYVVALTTHFRAMVGCRYVTLDSNPDLVLWYEAQGFKRNREEQAFRIQLAIERDRPVENLPVSMRFDLRDAREDRTRDSGLAG